MHCNGFCTEFEIAFKNFNVVVQSHCSSGRSLLPRKKMAELEEVQKKSKNHVDLTLVENYLRHQKFPDGVCAKGDKANFRRASRSLALQMNN